MANRATVKIGPAIDAKLYKEFVAVAKENGQSQRFLLEKAIEHYIHNVVPSQRTRALLPVMETVTLPAGCP